MRNDIPEYMRIIPSFPNYCVDRTGGTVVKLYGNGTTKVLAQDYSGRVTLFKDGKRYCRSGVQLMREAWFNKPLPNGRYFKPVRALHVAVGSFDWISFESMKAASEYTGVPVKYISEVINKPDRCSAYGWAFDDLIL